MKFHATPTTLDSKLAPPCWFCKKAPIIEVSFIPENAPVMGYGKVMFCRECANGLKSALLGIAL